MVGEWSALTGRVQKALVLCLALDSCVVEGKMEGLPARVRGRGRGVGGREESSSEARASGGPDLGWRFLYNVLLCFLLGQTMMKSNKEGCCGMLL